MLFSFLKYLQPTHYFQIRSKFGSSIFPNVDYLPEAIVEHLVIDDHYQSSHAKNYDLSWQAVKNGYIGHVPTYQSFEEVSIQDNYRFLRKQYHSAWILYVLIIRLVSLHNPISEITSWFRTRDVKKSKGRDSFLDYKEWQSFNSKLIIENPKVSIIIPTLNRYDYLMDILKDLEHQDYKNFEVLIIDQSDDFRVDFYKDFDLDLQLIRQEEKALWLARNTGIKKAKGDLIALSEDDVRIKNDWISKHLKCLDFFDCRVSAGVFYPQGKDIPKERSYFAIASQFATGNAMLYKEVFKTVGLFDRQFEKQRMGDGEFGLRLYLSDIKSISNPEASCIDVKAGTGGLREMGSWDSFRPSSFFAPRPIPSVLYYYRRYYGNAAARWALLRTIPISVFPYQFKKNKPLLVIGFMLTILILPLICYQVIKSWYLASKKLKEGPIIEFL